jgi:hydrogenase maturation protease
VARRLADQQLPEGVEVADFGIRGVHLAYQLLEGYDLAILVDASARGGEPGSLYVIEPTPGDGDVLLDGHGMQPAAVLGLLEALGGPVGRVLVVGCEPAEVGERIGLSEPVGRAVGEAVRLVRELVTQASATPQTRPG